MHIDGPFHFGVVDISHALGRGLYFSFTEDIWVTSTAGQIVEQLLPHLEQDEFPLENTIFIEINPDFAAGFLNIDGLTSY
jgi:hypothetical protein